MPTHVRFSMRKSPRVGRSPLSRVALRYAVLPVASPPKALPKAPPRSSRLMQRPSPFPKRMSRTRRAQSNVMGMGIEEVVHMPGRRRHVLRRWRR